MAKNHVSSAVDLGLLKKKEKIMEATIQTKEVQPDLPSEKPVLDGYHNFSIEEMVEYQERISVLTAMNNMTPVQFILALVDAFTNPNNKIIL